MTGPYGYLSRALDEALTLPAPPPRPGGAEEFFAEFARNVSAALDAAALPAGLAVPVSRRRRLAARIGTAGWTANDLLHRIGCSVSDTLHLAGARIENAGDRLAARIAGDRR